MSKHTKEPWNRNGGIIQSDITMIADARLMSTETAVSWGLVPVSTFGEMEANVDRIVACVNALEGIENPADLRKQRDELREALQALEQAYSNKHSPQHRAACLVAAQTTLSRLK